MERARARLAEMSVVELVEAKTVRNGWRSSEALRQTVTTSSTTSSVSPCGRRSARPCRAQEAGDGGHVAPDPAAVGRRVG